MKETNMEHYRGEIEELLNKGGMFTPAIVYGKPVYCGDLRCSLCECESDGCTVGFIKWLMSEYKEEPVLTEREKHFVEFAQEGWLAREPEGVLNWFAQKPKRDEDHECWNGAVYVFPFERLSVLFPFITWEDEEPWSVESLRKLKVADEE